MDGHVMTDPALVKQFLLAGDAYITLKSQLSGQHYTYQVTKAKQQGIPAFDAAEKWFVRVLANGDEYIYVGMIDPIRAPNLRLTKASKMDEGSSAVKAFRYFYGHLMQGRIAPQLEVRHDGRCGRCGRQLTHPESIDLGIGPDCAEIMGLGGVVRDNVKPFPTGGRNAHAH